MEKLEINKNSLREFSRILLDNVGVEDVKFFSEENSKSIKIIATKEGRSREFSTEKVENFPYNQKVVMAKGSLLKLFNKKYRWGSLTGVRPTKLINNFIKNEIEYKQIKTILKDIYLVSEEKADLLIDITKSTYNKIDSKSINIYIGIPYCPTKCNYCSFPSYVKTKKTEKQFKIFFDKLIEEIKTIGKLLQSKETKIESIYIGGGTPAILSEIELETLLENVHKYLIFDVVKEVNFEAGRTEIFSIEKLLILKKYNVNRICINPQTFNKDTLKKVNRDFNKEKFDEIYNKSKELGFIINMDFIIGLPEEDNKVIGRTIDKIYDYDIENITIHMLAIKRASKIGNIELEKLDENFIQNKTKKLSKDKDIFPYYMYRQKNSIQWGENLGYSKKGFESLFNINMINETQNTIGLGGGAISKFIDGEKIVRLINPKDPSSYINEFEKRIDNKIKMINNFLFQKIQ